MVVWARPSGVSYCVLSAVGSSLGAGVMVAGADMLAVWVRRGQ